MYAAVVHGKNKIVYEEIKTPVPGRKEVRVKVKFTGICGSDVPRVNEGTAHYFPIVLGHEFSGIIESVGPEVSRVKPGDHVAGVPLVPCMVCEDCKNGDYALCKNYSFIGSRQNGSFAEYVVVPEHNVFPFEPDIPFSCGAFFEPSCVAFHALRTVDYRDGDHVAVAGCGTIGFLLIQWLRIMGAKHITAINRSREKLETARELGADATVSTLDEDYKEQIMEITDGKGFDYIFDATGNSVMMKESFDFVANKGKVCMVGTPKRPMEFSVSEWEALNRKEFNLTGSWMSYSYPFPGEEWELTAHYFRTGELKVLRSMIDRVIPLSQIDKAFELYQKPGQVQGKILVDSER